MNDKPNFLVKTLVQRGESDNYIQARLLKLGIKETEAKELIHESRLNSEMVQPHLMTESEAALLILGMLALLILFAWMLLVSF